MPSLLVFSKGVIYTFLITYYNKSKGLKFVNILLDPLP